MDIQSVFTKQAPAPSGHYSQAVIHNGIVYVSGQLPIHPDTGEIVHGELAQIDQVFHNIEAILKASQTDWNRVLKLSVFLTRKDLWVNVNEKCKAVFAQHRPARIIVPEVKLKDGVFIEADVIAAI